jgi:DNA-directed RNA polymerase subunit M/transcription elongation factor TFIIS
MKENEFDSFSFSFNSKEVDPTELNAKIQKLLQEILDSRFPEHEKRRISEKVGRLNFACPYCGDSYSELHKKRGNIYTENFGYHCYNCGKHTTVRGLFKDFSKQLDTNEIIYIQSQQQEFTPSTKSIDPFVFLDKGLIEKVSLSRSALDEFYGAVPVDNSRIFQYLKKRCQPEFTKFSWDSEKEKLYIYHTVPGTDRALGFQVRNFKSTPKYMTWKLSRIYEDLGVQPTEDVLEIDKISTTFGILQLDFKQPITVFEGPLDSFLFKNAVATCSSKIDFPLEMGSIRYMYDYDAAGREASMEKLLAGYPVFLWKKYLDTAKIPYGNKKIDLTDLIVYAKRKQISLPRFGDFFSTNKYDAYWI